MERIWRGEGAQTNLAAARRRLSSTRSDAAVSRVMSRRPSTATGFRARIEFLFVSTSEFGKDAPKFTIPSSRKEDPAPPPSPGPGQYVIKPEPMDRKIKPRFPMSSRKEKAPDTADVGFIDARSFPEIKPLKIGRKTGTSFFDPIQTPGPSYIPPSSLSSQSHRITSRTSNLENKTRELNPAPCSYNPKNPALPSVPVIVVKGPKHRDDWLNDPMRNPGPGQYSPNLAILFQRVPVWTIGEKSRRSKERRVISRPKSKGIDRFVINLQPPYDDDECDAYIRTHPDLRGVIHDFMIDILRIKPDDPLTFLREFFGAYVEAEF